LIEGLLGNRFFIGRLYQTLPFFPGQSVSGTTLAKGNLFIKASVQSSPELISRISENHCLLSDVRNCCVTFSLQSSTPADNLSAATLKTKNRKPVLHPSAL
jgi:hypothetical protein